MNAIKAHRKWFVDPPKEKPTRKMFGLKEVPLISGDNLDTALAMPLHLFQKEYQEEIQREREYRLTKKQWDNYISWRDNRNPKRREMEDKFGYDAKHASHLFRLMLEGKELLLTGNITFPLPYAEEILAIKNGKYQYEEIVSMAESLDNQFNAWYDESPLPNAPDRNGLMEVYLDTVSNFM